MFVKDFYIFFYEKLADDNKNMKNTNSQKLSSPSKNGDVFTLSTFTRITNNRVSTVLPAKSDSGIMFCLQSYQDLESIDHLCINPIRRIGLIHQGSIDSRLLKWSVQVNVYVTIVNKTRRHCHSWLA